MSFSFSSSAAMRELETITWSPYLRGLIPGSVTTGICYNFSYFVLFTYVFSLFLEVSHGAAALTHFSLTHITATLLTIALP